jgi:hypothetical protein
MSKAQVAVMLFHSCLSGQTFLPNSDLATLTVNAAFAGQRKLDIALDSR